jgi:hypothetical protein
MRAVAATRPPLKTTTLSLGAEFSEERFFRKTAIPADDPRLDYA